MEYTDIYDSYCQIFHAAKIRICVAQRNCYYEKVLLYQYTLQTTGQESGGRPSYILVTSTKCSTAAAEVSYPASTSISNTSSEVDRQMLPLAEALAKISQDPKFI